MLQSQTELINAEHLHSSARNTFVGNTVYTWGVDQVQGGPQVPCHYPSPLLLGNRVALGYKTFSVLTEAAEERGLCSWKRENDMRTRSNDAVPPAFRRCGRARACKLTGADTQNHVKSAKYGQK